MDLIENEDACSRQVRVVLESAGEDTFCHDFDSSVFGDHCVVASSISDEFAESSAREFGHTLSNCSSGYSTWLENDDRVSAVNYAGLPSSPYADRAERLLPNGAGALFTISVKGGYDACVKLVSSLQKSTPHAPSCASPQPC